MPVLRTFLRELLTNFCLLITVASLGVILLRRLPDRSRGARHTLFFCTVPALVGALLMAFPVPWPGGAIIDLRQVPVFFAALLGGPLAGLVSAAELAAFRFWLGGPGALAGAASVLLAGLTAVLLLRRPVPLRRTGPILVRGLAVYVAGALPLWAVPDSGWALLKLAGAPLVLSQLAATALIKVILQARLEAVRREQEVSILARTDELTGLHNVRAMHQVLGARSGQKPDCLLLLDLDHFKQVNDTYGHAAGDLVLQQCARVLREAVREQDWVFRAGGEEFVVLLRGCSLATGQVVAERIRWAVENLRVQSGGQSLRITISGGLVHLEPGDDYRQCLAGADALLYRAKDTGRNRICVEGRRLLSG
jgi:diguanylate cyclase